MKILNQLLTINNNLIFYGVLLLIIIILICFIFFTRQTIIETFTNDSQSISIDLYTKLDSSGDYNDVGSFRIIKATFLKGTPESGYVDLSEPDSGYLDKITLKRKIAINAKDDLISMNKVTNFSKMDGNDESIDNLFLMSNDYNTSQESYMNSNGYYKFEIIGRKRQPPNETLDFEYNIYIKKNDVRDLNIELKENNDTISETTRHGESYYHVKGYVKNGTDYLIFKAINNSKSFIVEVELKDKRNSHINYSDAYIFLRDYYTNDNGNIIEPFSQELTSGSVSKLLCDRHIQYNTSFDIVPTNSNNFYKLKSSPDYTNNILFENVNDSYGQGISEDENRVIYNPFQLGGIFVNQQNDLISMNNVTWDRFSIKKSDDNSNVQPGLMYREFKNTVKSHPSNINEYRKMWENNRVWVSEELSNYNRVTSNLSNFSLKRNNYIVDFRGYFKPDKTGYYRFGISCDDAGYIVLKDWNTIVASWFGGHGSKGTSRPGGNVHGYHYLEANKYYLFWATFEEIRGGDNITTLYKYYETSAEANNDNTYMNNGSMTVIPSEMFFHQKLDIDSGNTSGVKFMSKDEFLNGYINNNSVYHEMVNNTYENEEELGDINKQVIDVNFVYEGKYRTHSMKVIYNFNNVELDNTISIIQFEFDNNQSYKKFINHYKNIYIGSNTIIQKANIQWEKTYNNNDTKYLIILQENGTYTENDIDIWAKQILGVTTNDKKYYSIMSVTY